MARVELPESRLRLRKRRRRIRLLLLLCAGIALLVAALVGATHLPFLQIRQVSVSGVHTLSSTTIQNFVEERISGRYGFIIPKRNIFLYPKELLNQELLRANPVLASADVHAVDFHSIAVALVERHPRALWCQQGSCYFMDEDGVVYAPAAQFSEPIYISYYGGFATLGALPQQYLEPGEFASLSALVDAIAQKLSGESIKDVSVDGEGDVRIDFVSGFTLLFVLKDNGGDIFERLSLALTAEPLIANPLPAFEYIDLRFGDKLYYKLRD